MLDLNELVDDVKAAELLHLEASSLKTMRSRGAGPIYYKVGKKIMYSLKDIRDYIARGRTDPTKMAQPKVEREAAVTVMDMAPEAVEIAEKFLKSGKVESRRENWRFPFGHSLTKPSAALLNQFGLPQRSDFLDVADEIERRMRPAPDINRAPHGWSRGAAPAQVQVERASRVMAASRKGGR